jgi:hypothetical protein
VGIAAGRTGAKAIVDTLLTMAPRDRVNGMKGLGQDVGAEEVDSDVLLERGTIAQVVVQGRARDR